MSKNMFFLIIMKLILKFIIHMAQKMLTLQQDGRKTN